MNALKQEIYEMLNEPEQSVKELKNVVDRYQELYPFDMDVYDLQIEIALLEGNSNRVFELAKEALKKYPYTPKFHCIIAHFYEETGENLYAYKHYRIGEWLYCDFEKNSELEMQIHERLQRVVARMECDVDNINDKEQYLERVNCTMECEKNLFGYYEKRFRNFKNMIGRYYYENEWSRKYIGRFQGYLNVFGREDMFNLINMAGEFREVTEIRDAELLGDDEKYIVPVAASQDNTVISFEDSGVVRYVLQRYSKSFYYYTLNAGTRIKTSNLCYMGKSMKVGCDKDKKKLILNIFLDGVAQRFISGDTFAEYMPSTYNYFKQGLICNQVYSTGEWTYPSLAGYVSSLYTTEHMLFHNLIDGKLPEDVKTLAEYFQEQEYYTSCFCGDWRIIPSYGHARGYERYIYQHQHTGNRVEQMVGKVIGQIEALKETNQFVFMTIGDLHDIADEFELPTDVQLQLELKNREIEGISKTSVKQSHSENKKQQYANMLKYIDMYLGLLFHYLEHHYQEDEITVTLFSDHGQGYLIPDGGEFLAPERSNVAFMFRDSRFAGKYSDEVISTIDYSAILCQLAGISYEGEKTSGKLPKIFGGEGRKWALTDSLHPGDPYRAALFSSEYHFYFCNDAPVGSDGRFELMNYTTHLTDKKERTVHNAQIEQECLELIEKHIAHLLIY